jgi:hypothetical protein
MDFNDTPEEAAFRAEARAWLEANAEYKVPGEAGNDALGERVDDATLAAAQAWQKKKADAGWACIRWPAEYGGRGATPIQGVIWGQEEAKFRTPPNIFGIGHGMCGPTVMTHGTPEQQKKWLPKLLSGEEIWCQLFSEPSAGSDLAGLRMTAVRDGDDWIVNGQKIWTTGAQFCDWGILVTRHDPTLPKHAGLTYFVVDMHAPGIEVRPITQINGGQGFNEVFFTDVRIPDGNRLGEIGDGWRVAITTLMNERASIGGGGGGRRPGHRGSRGARAAGLLLHPLQGCGAHGPSDALRALPGQDAGARGEPDEARVGAAGAGHLPLRDGAPVAGALPRHPRLPHRRGYRRGAAQHHLRARAAAAARDAHGQEDRLQGRPDRTAEQVARRLRASEVELFEPGDRPGLGICSGLEPHSDAPESPCDPFASL